MYTRKRQMARIRKEPYFSEKQCWNLDYALARIIAGGLRSFIRMKRYGVPSFYVEDNKNPDSFADAQKMDDADKRWNEDLAKMLWSFEQIADDYPDDPHTIWFNKAWKETEGKGVIPFDFDENRLVDNLPDAPDSVWKDAEEYRAKIKEGLTLFAEHFESLWD